MPLPISRKGCPRHASIADASASGADAFSPLWFDDAEEFAQHDPHFYTEKEGLNGTIVEKDHEIITRILQWSYMHHNHIIIGNKLSLSQLIETMEACTWHCMVSLGA